jgi:hypothetical protein
MNLQVIKNRAKKVFVYTVTSILFLILAAFLVLQMPPVQNWLISIYLKDFSAVVGFPASVREFKMLWFDRVELSGVKIEDPSGNGMIQAEKILINFKLSRLLDENDINIDGVYVDSAHVLITKIQESDTSRDLNINVWINRINENFSGSGGGKSPKIKIGEAFVNGSKFSYIDQYRDPIKTGFNYNQFTLDLDEAQLTSFAVIGDTTEFNLNTLIATDTKTKFKIKEMSTFFRHSQGGMEFKGLNLRAGESIVRDTIILTYKRNADMSDFVTKVNINAKLNNCILQPADLALFAPGIEKITKPIHFTGDFNGRIEEFRVTKMDASIGSTNLKGSLSMDGLPVINETFIDLDLSKSQLNINDIDFLFNEDIANRLEPMGKLHLDGQFLGYPTDFVANGTFIGRLGTIRSDINFKVNEKDFNLSEYSGNLKLISFSLGELLRDTTNFQQVAMDGKITGSGMTKNTADFKLNGKISSVGIKGYNYTNITTNARFASGLFNGLLKINDPNLELDAEGSIDLRDGRNRIQVQARLDTAYIHNLKLSRDDLFVHASFEADFTGLSLDSLDGEAAFKDLKIRYKEKYLHLDSIKIITTKTNTSRELKIESNLMDGEIKGNYLYSSISHDIQVLAKEFSLNLRNNEAEIQDYYSEKKSQPDKYRADIQILLKDIRPVSDLFNIDLTVSKNTLIQGNFSSGYTSIFNIYSRFDTLTYQGTTFFDSDAEITASKIADSTSVLAMATINSARQQIARNLETKNLLAEGIWSRNHIDFSLDADQEGLNNLVRLSGAVDFLRDSTAISMNPSLVRLLEKEWTFKQGNYVSFHNQQITFHELGLVTGNQNVAVDGKLSQDPKDIISLKIGDLDLSIFNIMTLKRVNGIMNAEIDMSNYYKKPLIQNSIEVKGLMVDNFLIGDLVGKNLWDTTRNEFDIGISISRDEHRLVNLEGYYKPSQRNSPLNVKAQLVEADLKILEPFLTDIFPSLIGNVSGDFTITGRLEEPQIEGEGTIPNGQIVIGYLKTLYQFKGIVGLTPNSIYFKNMELEDGLKNKGSLNGRITHKNFNKMAIEMDAEFQNLQVLNTTIKDNSLFYGQAYASGNLKIEGPISNLNIYATAKTEKNTRIYIPISGSSEVEKKDFISFVNFKDTTFIRKINNNLKRDKVRLTGLMFDLNLDVTPDAYCEIIFDPKSGDIIRGRGNGDIKLQMDTKGEFNMFGPFEFTEGWYNFTLYDIINKEFEIKKGSKITWYGDPYQGILDINASYNQQASFAPLVEDNASNADLLKSPYIRRKYPVEVIVDIEGLMLSSKISFDINARDLPKSISVGTNTPYNLDIMFNAFKNKLDEQELKRQVFSLIVLRRFSPPESFNTSGTVMNSVSELLSNQLSYWMSQVDQNLVIDVDLNVMDQEAFNTFQLRFSYTFFNGRLRVSGDGTYNSTNNNANAQASPSSLAGDWTVDYMLTADGKLRIKMYSRTNINQNLASVNNQNTITTGLSLIHTQSFDELSELFRRGRKQKKKQESASLNEEATKEDEVAD